MAVSTPLDPFLRGATSKNTRGLLRIIILVTIAAAAVAARLFSVIRMHFHIGYQVCDALTIVHRVREYHTRVSVNAVVVSSLPPLSSTSRMLNLSV